MADAMFNLYDPALFPECFNIQYQAHQILMAEIGNEERKINSCDTKQEDENVQKLQEFKAMMMERDHQCQFLKLINGEMRQYFGLKYGPFGDAAVIRRYAAREGFANRYSMHFLASLAIYNACLDRHETIPKLEEAATECYGIVARKQNQDVDTGGRSRLTNIDMKYEAAGAIQSLLLRRLNGWLPQISES